MTRKANVLVIFPHRQSVSRVYRSPLLYRSHLAGCTRDAYVFAFRFDASWKSVHFPSYLENIVVTAIGFVARRIAVDAGDLCIKRRREFDLTKKLRTTWSFCCTRGGEA